MQITCSGIRKQDSEWIVTFHVSSIDGVSFNAIGSAPTSNEFGNVSGNDSVKIAYQSVKDQINETFQSEEAAILSFVGSEIDAETGDFIVLDDSEDEETDDISDSDSD